VRFLADENVHRKVVAALRAQGYEVEWIREESAGSLDPQILQRADISMLAFITNDRDFGELIFAKNLPAPAAILYTRTQHRDWELTTERLTAVIKAGRMLGQFVTITPDTVRYKPLPTGIKND
jgi:predicted nuclease of predicted toxin-antitoxin system